MTGDRQPGFRVAHGLRIRCAEAGSSSSRRIVLTSPWAGSVDVFDKVRPRLARMARLLVIDLPGFGRSERRAGLLSPAAMSRFLIRLLDEWEIEDPHLVCPDHGTPAALLAAAGHPGRIRSLVVSGPGGRYPLPPGDLRLEMFKTPESAVLGRIYTPVQIIAGRRDPLVPLASAVSLQAVLPNSRLDVLNTGHFAWTEGPADYAALIAAWVGGRYLMGETGT